MKLAFSSNPSRDGTRRSRSAPRCSSALGGTAPSPSLGRLCASAWPTSRQAIGLKGFVLCIHRFKDL
jgi:hypothetical protein